MKIRWKLMILLLAIALVPLIVDAMFHRMATRHLGKHLATETREGLEGLSAEHCRLFEELGSDTRDVLAEMGTDNRAVVQELASATRRMLSDRAKGRLEELVDHYGRTLGRDKEMLELALRYQAREVEARLAGPVPPARRLYSSADYDRGVDLPGGVIESPVHMPIGADGKGHAMAVTFLDQVYFLVAGTPREALSGDLGRLATMPKAYRVVHETNPQVIYWQYTALSGGVHTSYPGHGGYPADYDPRKRSWYTAAIAAKDGSPTWGPPLVDVTTRAYILSLSMTVRRPDGSVAGVTGLDVKLVRVFRDLKLPPQWAQAATALMVWPRVPQGQDRVQLAIVAENRGQGAGRHWRDVPKLRYVEADDPAALDALTKDTLAGRAGVRRMTHKGQDALWAYGATNRSEIFPIIIVPTERIIADAVRAEGRMLEKTTDVKKQVLTRTVQSQRDVLGKVQQCRRDELKRADRAEQYVLDRTFRGIQFSGAILLAAVVLVTALAFYSARAVSRPVSQLCDAGEKLAGGDYTSRVDIRTRDEFQELAQIFNDIGPKLDERERLKQSLALAMEIQQHLLPQESPTLAGFDIAGKSVYCDETGGDYYDFIDLLDIGEGKLAVAVGDVTGHGIGAALLMASARGVLRSHAALHGTDLDAVFEALNAHLVRDTGEERFMTLFYGVLDADARSMVWTSGGHDPLLWLHRRTGEIEELPNTGIPLGVLREATYRQAGPVTIVEGDVMVIGTDGIWEAHNAADEMFGKQRLRDLIVSGANDTAEEIRNSIVAAVAAFRADHPQEDDITLVILKATSTLAKADDLA